MVDHGPAVNDRKLDKGYPFGDKYPTTIRVKKYVRSDFAFLESSPAHAKAGQELPAWTNSYGAVSAILPDGRMLGLYPNEFEVIEWANGQ